MKKSRRPALSGGGVAVTFLLSAWCSVVAFWHITILFLAHDDGRRHSIAQHSVFFFLGNPGHTALFPYLYNHYFGGRTIVASKQQQQQQQGEHQQQRNRGKDSAEMNDDAHYYNRVLYIVTSLAEFDNGRRATEKGYDRFSNTLLPALVESVSRMTGAGYHVDFYLICHYPLTEARRRQLRDALPSAVGIQYWDDATPLGYSKDISSTNIRNMTQTLARQHRYVIKDKFLHYDVFVNFEDDMLITGAHIDQFTAVANELYRRGHSNANNASSHWNEEDSNEMIVIMDDDKTEKKNKRAQDKYYGPMSNAQYSRMIPGFIRVEASLPDFRFQKELPKHRRENDFDHIPMDYAWNNSTLTAASLDASICCHVSPRTVNDHIPPNPGPNDLFFWETSIDALGVRQLPPQRHPKQQLLNGGDHDHYHLEWVLMMAGNSNDVIPDPRFVIGDYWSGRDGYFEPKLDKRPERNKGRYMNNQGGWMGTQRQILQWHRVWCRGGFLPPYNSPVFVADGQRKVTVEYWSGGLQLAGSLACNLQRIIPLDPSRFSRHLLYHTSNNKQKQHNVRYRFSQQSIEQFWAQLNTVKKNAEKHLKELREKNKNKRKQQQRKASSSAG